MRLLNLQGIAISIVASAAILPPFFAGCASAVGSTGDAPYEIQLIKGVDWVKGREGYRPELPGFVLDGDIGTILLQAKHAGAPDRVVLLIRTTPAQRPNLEGFTFAPPGRTFSTSPFSQSATVEVRESGKNSIAGHVPLNAYFDFRIEGDFVRVTFLPSATEFMTEECQVSWVDWYRR
jgi:hypothetical protein